MLSIVAVVYLVYRCLKEHGLPSINIKTTGGHSGAVAGTAELTPLLPDSTIRGTTIEKFLNEIAREKPIQFTSEQLDRYTQQRSAELGAGGYGVVYKGMLPNGLDVAVKFLHDHMGTDATEQQFMAEMGSLWRTNHANLIRLIGFCFDAGGRALVYEFMSKTSLDKYLFDRSHRVSSPATLLAVATGVARGLRYLHEECQKKIIHYDVKPGNVLLDGGGGGGDGEALTAKLTDFGIAQLLSRADTHASVHGLRGTVGYMAPEVINGGSSSPVTEKCDVYSFGMLLFEIIGRRKNMDNDAVEEDRRWLPLLAWTKFDNGELMDLVKEWRSVSDVEEEERWKETAERMCKVAFLCVRELPEARPTMSMVVNMLEGYVDIPAPVYPFGWMYPPEAASSHCSDASGQFVTSRD
ncbi:hypothetical protein HU200_028048 [Digitaria exilis]|uniref:Protein kinase domain-containing protein n=1 Tax=Digitaria exilis TaxID=1010633 RepID=A0A835C0W1_9POAL|nr:hypothetical protein HU200_028048 [Digitaria exilis]